MTPALTLVIAFVAAASSAHPFGGFERCLHTPYQGITVTSPTGEILGPVDPQDWGCADFGGRPRFETIELDDVGPVPPPTSLCLREAFPNPAQGATRLQISVPASMHMTLAIYGRSDEPGARARLVRTLIEGTFAAGTHQVLWDLKDDSGVPVAPGIYRAILVAGGRVLCGDIQVP